MNHFSALTIGQEFKLSFDLGISGTSKLPNEVRLSVGSNPKYSVLCTALSNTNYEAQLLLPIDFPEGSYEVIIEVIIGNKIFVPYKETVSLSKEVPVFNPDQGPIKTDNFISQDELKAAATRYDPLDKEPIRKSEIFHTELKAALGQTESLDSNKDEKVIKDTGKNDPDLFKKILDYEEKNKINIKEEVKEEIREFKQPVKQIKLKKLVEKKRDKIESKPLVVDFNSLSEQTKDIKPIDIEEPKVIIKESKGSLFKITKTKIVEK